MAIWTIARKEARLLLRDPRAGIILIAMPFIFILVLGLSLGEGFGKKPDDTLHISVVDLDVGYTEPAAAVREATAGLAWPPQAGPAQSAIPPTALSAVTLTVAQRLTRFPQQTWAREVQRDLSESNIKVEVITTVEEAQKLVKAGKRAAILVFGPDFSKQVHQSSFLARESTRSIGKGSSSRSWASRS